MGDGDYCVIFGIVWVIVTMTLLFLDNKKNGKGGHPALMLWPIMAIVLPIMISVWLIQEKFNASPTMPEES